MLNPLDMWPMLAIRRNHALEHATIHVLSEAVPDLAVAGRSDWAGFTLYGQLATADVAAAVTEALTRLQAGEILLALHSRCGTNVATGAVLVGLTSYAAFHGNRRSRLEKVLQWVVGIAAAVFLSRPLGTRVQQSITTSPDVGPMRVLAVRQYKRGGMVMHRVVTVQA